LGFNGLVKTYFMLRIPSRELSISLERESRAPYGNGNGNGEDLVRQSDECECESTDLALPSVAEVYIKFYISVCIISRNFDYKYKNIFLNIFHKTPQNTSAIRSHFNKM